jgi:hypothetical protein
MGDILYNNEQFKQQKEQQLQECGLSALMKAQRVPSLSSSSHTHPTVSQLGLIIKFTIASVFSVTYLT